MSRIENQALNQVKTLAKLAGQPRISVELYEWYEFQRPCQDGVDLAYKVKGIEYEKGDPSFIPEDFNLPEAIILLSARGLGSTVHTLDDVRKDKQIADEMTDPLCIKAGCNGGVNCVLKRKSST